MNSKNKHATETWSPWRSAALILAAAVVAVGCANADDVVASTPEDDEPAVSDDGDTDADDRAAAASEAGEVVYAGYISEPFAAALQDQWAQDYPDVELTIISGRVGEIQERIQTELRTGNVQTDVVSSGGHWLEVFKRADMLEEFQLPDDIQMTLPSDPDDMWHPVGFFGYGFAVNTDIVEDVDRPTSWYDLTDERWQGDLLMDDPQSGSTGFGWTIELLNDDAFGESYVREVADQNPSFVAGTTQPFGQLARGEYSLYFPALPGETQDAMDAGAPIEWIQPEEGVYETRFNVGIIRDAPNRPGAELLIEYLLRPEILELRHEVDVLFPAIEIEGVESPPLVKESDFDMRIEETARAEEINQDFWGR